MGEPPNFFFKLVKSFVIIYIGKVKKKSGSLFYAPVAATNILKCRLHFEPPPPMLNRVNGEICEHNTVPVC